VVDRLTTRRNLVIVGYHDLEAKGIRVSETGFSAESMRSVYSQKTAGDTGALSGNPAGSCSVGQGSGIDGFPVFEKVSFGAVEHQVKAAMLLVAHQE
jgi:hypothetical protein